MKIFCYFLLALSCLTSVSAQNLTGEEVVAAMEAEVDKLQDVEAIVKGRLSNIEGIDLPLEVLVQLIKDKQIARAEFFEPLELADNFLLLNEEAVYNYLFLTNQVTVLDATDPDAFGTFFPEAADTGEALNYDLSLERLFTGWTAEKIGYQAREVDGQQVNTYRVRLDSPGAADLYVIFEAVDESWQPHFVGVYQKVDDVQLLELYFHNFKRDSGLNPDDVTYIPADAEIIDER